MVKFVVVIHHRADFTREAFRDYFRTVHVPLAEALPGLKRYLLDFPTDDAKRPPPAWDLVVELYFDTPEAMEAAWESREGRAATDDLEAFADLERTSWARVEVEERR